MKNLLLLFLISAISTAYSEENYEDALKSNFVNNSGRDFWFTVPPAYLISGIDNFIKIFVFSEEETEVTVSVPGLGYKELKAIPKNNVAVYNISPATAQVKIYNYNEGPLEAVLHRGRGINVSSKDLITVYCVVRYSGTSDGFLCLPTNSLGNSYIASSYTTRPGGSEPLPNMVGVTATQDNTKMKFTLGGNAGTEVPLGGGVYLLPGQAKTYQMNRGDVIIFSNRDRFETLTGSLIEADKNISVVSSHYCADVPVNNHWCDYLGEMDLPIHTWGKNYHIPAIQNRKYSGVLRIMAKEDATTVYRDGVEIGFIKTGLGGLENDAWIETRVLPYLPDDTGVAIYSSDKPIYTMFYNPGTQEDGNGDEYEPIDPFTMTISPVEQYQTELTLTPPISNEQGKNFETNYLNLIYPITTHKNDSIKIEVAVAKNGKFEFSPLNVSTTFNKYVIPQKVGIDFPNGMENLQYVHAIIKAEEGVQKIKSNKPIMAYLYGGDPYDSYGYPASLGLYDLSTPDTIPPLVEWEMDCLGLVEGGTAQDLPEDKNIRSNLYDIRVIQEETFNFGDVDFEPTVAKGTKVIPPDTEFASWTIRVEDKTKEAKATIMFLDRAGNITIETILYYPQELILVDDVTGDSENSFYGADIRIGDKVVRTFKITNQSEMKPLVLDRFELKNDSVGFKIIKYPESPIPPLESAYLEAEFEATQQGRYASDLGVGNNCIFDFTMYLEAIVGMALMSAYDVEFEDKFDIADENAKPLKNKIVLSASCNNEFGSNLIVTGIDDSQLPPEFTHNISSSFTVPTGNGENGVIDFEIEFMPTAVGKFEGYIAFIAANGGCDSICYISAESFSSKSIEETASINIHPNPVKDELNISFINNSIKNYDIQLVDMTGNILYSIITRTNQTINMNKYSTGLYYIIIKDKSGKMIRKEKIIKQ